MVAASVIHKLWQFLNLALSQGVPHHMQKHAITCNQCFLLRAILLSSPTLYPFAVHLPPCVCGLSRSPVFFLLQSVIYCCFFIHEREEERGPLGIAERKARPVTFNIFIQGVFLKKLSGDLNIILQLLSLCYCTG